MNVYEKNGINSSSVEKLRTGRILLLGKPLTDEVANEIVANMLFLAYENTKEDIKLLINTPGGSVSAGLAIFDVMNSVPCDVQTICLGSAASMGAFLLAAGTKGKRKAYPNSRIMLHQPLGGVHGQVPDLKIQAEEILYTRQLLNTYLALFTGHSIDKIQLDCDRDFFMSAVEACKYNLVDEVIKSKVLPIEIQPTLVL